MQNLLMCRIKNILSFTKWSNRRYRNNRIIMKPWKIKSNIHITELNHSEIPTNWLYYVEVLQYIYTYVKRVKTLTIMWKLPKQDKMYIDALDCRLLCHVLSDWLIFNLWFLNFLVFIDDFLIKVGLHWLWLYGIWLQGTLAQNND